MTQEGKGAQEGGFIYGGEQKIASVKQLKVRQKEQEVILREYISNISGYKKIKRKKHK